MGRLLPRLEDDLAALAGGLGLLTERLLLAVGLWDLLALVTGGITVALVYGALTWWRDVEVRQGVRQVLVQINR